MPVPKSGWLRANVLRRSPATWPEPQRNHLSSIPPTVHCLAGCGVRFLRGCGDCRPILVSTRHSSNSRRTLLSYRCVHSARLQSSHPEYKTGMKILHTVFGVWSEELKAGSRVDNNIFVFISSIHSSHEGESQEPIHAGAEEAHVLHVHAMGGY